ncbi:nudix hydrolase-like protein [Mortierella polycephala]|uniref:Nudix hydrolase-like protein n=1 Tax=Mortierella polycephala TaxID=41804 RepID=A0A9P6QAB7_9FUNG|nr:nudix hydrolase-like protein [Mortierella polycephala]
MSILSKQLSEVKNTNDTKLGSGRWLSLHEVKFNDPSGTQRSWEVCRRVKPTTANSPKLDTPSVDAVDVIVIIKNKSGIATNIVLVVQYRPALGAYTVEFPSGLIDADELPAAAALRELDEETGFSTQSGHSIKVVRTSPLVAYEPGLTGSCSQVCTVEVEMEQEDLFGPKSSLRKSKLEEDEWSLQVAILPLTGLLNSLQDLQASVGGPSKLVLDSRLYAWATGRESGY